MTEILKKNIERTFLRSETTMNAYIDYVAKASKMKKKKNPFDDIEDRAIVKFEHWLIIKNDFPYDAVAEDSHLLFTRREVPFEWGKLDDNEMKEFVLLKKGYLSSTYNTLWENLPKGQTVPGHFHLQVLNFFPDKMCPDINIEKSKDVLKVFRNWVIVGSSELDKETEREKHILVQTGLNGNSEKELSLIKKSYLNKKYELIRESLPITVGKRQLQLVNLRREAV